MAWWNDLKSKADSAGTSSTTGSYLLGGENHSVGVPEEEVSPGTGLGGMRYPWDDQPQPVTPAVQAAAAAPAVVPGKTPAQGLEDYFENVVTQQTASSDPGKAADQGSAAANAAIEKANNGARFWGDSPMGFGLNESDYTNPGSAGSGGISVQTPVPAQYAADPQVNGYWDQTLHASGVAGADAIYNAGRETEATATQLGQAMGQAGVAAQQVGKQYADTLYGDASYFLDQAGNAVFDPNQELQQRGANATRAADFNWDPSQLGAGFNSRLSASSLNQQAQNLLDYAGPSEAELQMDRALDQNVAAQMALAQSGRGAYSGYAMKNAQATAAAMGQQTAAQQAALRAQEWATRQNLAGTMFEAGGQIGNANDQLRLGVEDLNLRGATTGAEFGLERGAQLADIGSAMTGEQLAAFQAEQAAQQGYGNLALTADQSAAGVSQDAWNSFLDATGAGINTQMQGQELMNQANVNAFQMQVDVNTALAAFAHDYANADANRKAQLWKSWIEGTFQSEAMAKQMEAQYNNSIIGAIGSGAAALGDFFGGD